MPVSRTMWLRGLNEDYAKMKHNAYVERNDARKAEEKNRKDKLLLLEREHVQKVMNIEKAYITEIDALAKSHAETIAQGPPKY